MLQKTDLNLLQPITTRVTTDAFRTVTTNHVTRYYRHYIWNCYKQSHIGRCNGPFLNCYNQSYHALQQTDFELLQVTINDVMNYSGQLSNGYNHAPSQHAMQQTDLDVLQPITSRDTTDRSRRSATNHITRCNRHPAVTDNHVTRYKILEVERL